MFSREQLLDSVWGRDIYIDERTVDVHIGRLRKLLNPGREPDPIRTVRGAGYALDDRFAKAERAASTSCRRPRLSQLSLVVATAGSGLHTPQSLRLEHASDCARFA